MENDAQILLTDAMGVLNTALADVQRLYDLKSRDLRVATTREIADALRIKINTVITDLMQSQPVAADKDLTVVSGGLIVAKTT